MTLSDSTAIFHNRSVGNGPAEPKSSPSEVYDPRLDTTRLQRVPSATKPPQVRPGLDADLIAILDRPRGYETVNEQFVRKEHELGAIFAKLTIYESHVLHKRLATPQANDELAIKF